MQLHGTVLAKDVKVKLCGQGELWCDYVFDPNYKLMPLAEVKKFVNTNKHLPNTPSASDIDKNDGFNIGEIFVSHQEKIEEIYLHLIALKKNITGLQKKIST